MLGDTGSKDGGGVKHEIKMVAAKSSEVYVTNLTQIKVTDKTQVCTCITVLFIYCASKLN